MASFSVDVFSAKESDCDLAPELGVIAIGVLASWQTFVVCEAACILIQLDLLSTMNKDKAKFKHVLVCRANVLSVAVQEQNAVSDLLKTYGSMFPICNDIMMQSK